MKGESVVDADDDVVHQVVQAVAALAVGVVDEHVVERELAETILVSFEQREVVLVGVVLDETLYRSLAERAVAQIVMGTMSQPSACESSYAATSRSFSHSVPSGKSHNGRSPRRGGHRAQLQAVDPLVHEERRVDE